jgi:hypothetical protein
MKVMGRAKQSAKFRAAAAMRAFDKMADHVVELIRAHEKQLLIIARAKEDSDEERAAFEAQEKYEGQITRFLFLFVRWDPVFLRLVADKLEGRLTKRRKGFHDDAIEAACERVRKAQLARHWNLSNLIPVRSDAEREWFTTTAIQGASRRSFNRTVDRLGIATRPGKPGRRKKRRPLNVVAHTKTDGASDVTATR